MGATARSLSVVSVAPYLSMDEEALDRIAGIVASKFFRFLKLDFEDAKQTAIMLILESGVTEPGLMYVVAKRGMIDLARSTTLKQQMTELPASDPEWDLLAGEVHDSHHVTGLSDEDVLTAIHQLFDSEYERYVIYRRYQGASNEVIGKELCVTAVRVSQILVAARNKLLLHPSKRRFLNSLLTD